MTETARRTPTVGVGVVIFRVFEDGPRRLLLGKRGPACKRGAGFWALPGGHVDSGQTLAEAVRAEVKSETGLDLASVVDDPFGPWGPRVFAVTDHFSHGLDHLSVWCIAHYRGGEAAVLEPTKCTEWRWVTLAELLAIPGAAEPPIVPYGDEQHYQYYWTPGKLLRHYLGRELAAW
jgi:8-oxo-dGTP diphosphatase